jgi:hypothetical protein
MAMHNSQYENTCPCACQLQEVFNKFIDAPETLLEYYACTGHTVFFNCCFTVHFDKFRDFFFCQRSEDTQCLYKHNCVP